MKRALALAGGGPACGLQIGALQRFAEENMAFDVWALSCIGAWVGVIYHQFDKKDAPERTAAFFRDHIFREDRSYDRFPINQVFAPDLIDNAGALASFLGDPRSYQNLYVPGAMLKQIGRNLAFALDRQRWNQGDFNLLVLENLAAHPLSRFATSLMYRSPINGLSRIYYENSSFLKSLDFDALDKDDRPFIYHNAWNVTRQRLDLFANARRPGYFKLTPQSLCACSALPYIEETVEMNGDVYCEGALVDTVNFKRLLEDHPDLDEVWVLRIVSKEQIRAPQDLTEGLANLCMLFAASVGEDDVKLFVNHVKEDRREDAPEERRWPGRVYEIPVATGIDFDWNVSNLEAGIAAGYRETSNILDAYKAGELQDLTRREKPEHEKLQIHPGRKPPAKDQRPPRPTVV
ncbi:MAG: patatin-like phospholipase family protein [Alphaproteobacteria bacterium]|jgi:predicted acylesterase/phospholipase RssA|nr:patatin-like phospholipase family protein [Alphaproteobacteria bacterium]